MRVSMRNFVRRILAQYLQEVKPVSNSVPFLPVSQPSLPSFQGLREGGFDLPSVEDVCAEMAVLNAAWKAIETGKGGATVQRGASSVLLSRGVFFTTEEDHVVSGCLAKLAGQDASGFLFPLPQERLDWVEEVAVTISYAWMMWLVGKGAEVRGLLSDLRSRQADGEEEIKGRAGAVNLMCLYYWLSAVEVLLAGDQETSQRLWRRALEIGGQFGTDSHPLISWTYVASFCPSSH